MEIGKIKGNSYFLKSFTNIGLFIKDDIVTLIDSGLDDDAAKEIDDTLLRSNLKVNNIILTHAHSDHMGGANYFQQKYNCNVLTTLADTAIANLSIMNTSLIYGGIPINLAKGKMLYSKSCNAHLLTDKTTPSGIKIIDLRGHSINMIGVLTEDNVFYIADSLVSKKTINKFPLTYILDIENYFISMDKLLTVGAEYFVPSHAEIQDTESIKELIELNKDAVKQNIIDILYVLSEPLEIDDIVYNYCLAKGYTMKTSQFFVATSTIKNYLAYLDKIEKVQAFIVDNRLFFKRIDEESTL